MPTLMGYDSDDPRSLGEVGREGVAVDSLDDVEALLDGIDLENIAVNLMPTAIELVKARATMGEITARLREVGGRYVERPVF